MGFKPIIKTINDSKFYSNGLCFATREEAEFSAKDIYSRWMLATEWGVEESDEPVNYRIDLETMVMTAVGPEDALVARIEEAST